MPHPGCCCADCNDNCINGTRPTYVVATIFGCPNIHAAPWGGTVNFYNISQYDGEFKLVNVYPDLGPYFPNYPITWCYRYLFTALDNNPLGATGMALHFRAATPESEFVTSWSLSWYKLGFAAQFTTTYVGATTLGSLTEDYNCLEEHNGTTSTTGAFFWYGQTPSPEGWATIEFH